MSEQAPGSGFEKFEVLKTPEHLALPTAEQAEPLRPGEADPTKRAETASQTIEQSVTQENPLKRLEAAQEASETPPPRHVNRELRGITLQRELTQLRRKLPAPARQLSKVVHQPAVKAVSEAAATTVSRPSGLLGGGLVAFIGTSAYLYLAKHLGFAYNYLLFAVLFAAGFMIGLALELAVHVTIARRQAD